MTVNIKIVRGFQMFAILQIIWNWTKLTVSEVIKIYREYKTVRSDQRIVNSERVE